MRVKSTAESRPSIRLSESSAFSDDMDDRGLTMRTLTTIKEFFSFCNENLVHTPKGWRYNRERDGVRQLKLSSIAPKARCQATAKSA